jgi:hypothetical protein
MDQVYSQASLQLPTVPADFESRAGSNKTDLAKAIFALLQGAPIVGINPADPNNFDLGTIVNRITALETNQAAYKIQQRVVSLTGVNNDILTYSFADMATTNYTVNICIITPSGGLSGTITWSLVANSKTGTGCQIYIKGDATAYQVELTATENKNLGG